MEISYQFFHWSICGKLTLTLLLYTYRICSNIIQKITPSDLVICFLLPLRRCAWHLGCIWLHFQYQTCSVNFCDNFYVQADIFEGWFFVSPNPIKNKYSCNLGNFNTIFMKLWITICTLFLVFIPEIFLEYVPLSRTYIPSKIIQEKCYRLLPKLSTSIWITFPGKYSIMVIW